MTLDPRHRRALPFLAALLIVGIAIRFWPESAGPVVAPSGDIAFQERRLAKLRETAATVPAEEQILKRVTGETRRAGKRTAGGRYGRAGAGAAHSDYPQPGQGRIACR